MTLSAPVQEVEMAATTASETENVVENVVEDTNNNNNDDFPAPPQMMEMATKTGEQQLNNPLGSMFTMVEKEGNHEMQDDDGGLYGAEGKVWIKQILNKGSIIEFLTGCEAKNVYKVYDYSKGCDSTAIYTMTEESDCMWRVCCGPHRPLTFRLREGDGRDGRIVASFVKELDCADKCPCALFTTFRPRFTVFKGNTKEKLGTINDPFSCCTINQYVTDAADKEMYRLSGSICQPALCCPCLQPCMDVHFGIWGAGAGMSDPEIGALKKEPGGCMELLFSINKFSVKFPANVSTDHKHMLVATAMLCDLAYFEKQGQQG